MQSGRETLAGIEQALRDLKIQETALQAELETANAERTKLQTERLELLRVLARIRAQDAIADGVIDEADNLSHQMRASLIARLRTIRQLEERQAKADTERQNLVARQDALVQRIAGLEEQLDRLAAEARTQLESDPAFKELSGRHARLDAMLGKAVEKADLAARDEHEKGQPYRDDPLFMYLWRRQMGTPSYKASGLIRTLDTWVAGLVRYTDARANYAMLTEIPVRLRAHADDVRRQTMAEKVRLDDMLAQRTRELAGTDLIATLEQERSQQQALDGELETITSELTETGNQLKLYAKAEDQSFQAAVLAYTAFLEREPLRRLISDAAATETHEDDRIAADMRRIAEFLEGIETAATTNRRRLEQMSERRLELTRLASNFRRQRYDDVGSQFSDNPKVDDLLQMLLRGAITAADYWMRMQQQQQWRHRPGDPWRRQSGLPPFDGFPGGWGGGGGRRRNEGGGTRGSGGGFGTGGTF
jgi:chromosome segregation ATPase